MAKRNPNGAGTITKRKDGRYQGAAYVTNASGQRVRKFVYGKTWDEAADELAKLQANERKGVPVPDKSWKAGPYLEYWLAELVKVRPSTYAKYESMTRLYLVPELGKKPLTRLTPAHVRTFLKALDKQEVGRATQVECLKTLRNALNRAIREELLVRNVAALVDMPSVESKEIVPWTAAEAIAFLRVARSHRLFAAYVLALVLGLRRGELLGLRWTDVDLAAGQFTPRKQVQRQKGKLVVVDLKTRKSKAALPLPRICIEALGDRKRLQEIERQQSGDNWHDSGLIFTERNGGPIDPDGFSGTFTRLVARGKLRAIRLHDTRHTCGTLLASLKVHPRVAMEILRHSQIAVTMEIYTHVASDDQREAAARLGAALWDGVHGR